MTGMLSGAPHVASTFSHWKVIMRGSSSVVVDGPERRREASGGWRGWRGWRGGG